MNIEKITSSLASIVFGAIAFILIMGLHISPNYSNFIVGSLAWYDGEKLQDLIVWPIVIIFIFLSFKIMNNIIIGLHKTHGDKISISFMNQVLLWSLPFYASLGSLVFRGSFDKLSLIISCVGIFFISFLAFNNKKNNLNPQLWGLRFLTILFIILIPFEIAILINRMQIHLIGDVSIRNYMNFVVGILIIAIISGIILSIKHENFLQKHFSKIILFSQIGLPFFFVTLYPAKLLQPSGELTKYHTTIFLKLFIILLIVIAIYDIIKRYKKYSHNNNFIKLFSPIAIFAILLAIKAGYTIAPQINSDDYHFGEVLLGTWSYIHGVIPYVGYIPAHGIVHDDFKLLLSYVFYDGTAATVAELGRLSFAILGFIAFLSIYLFSRSIIVALLSIFLMGDDLTWLFLIPFICLWLNPSLKCNPTKWIVIYALTAPIVLLGVPPQGLLLIVAFSPLAAIELWRQFNTKNKASWLYIGSTVVLILLVLALTPSFFMLLGAVNYVLENGTINQLAYGVPWSISWHSDSQFKFVFEAIRMSWVALPIFCLYVIGKTWRNFKSAKSHFYTASVFFLFSLLLIPYSMGRVDPSDLSRPGIISIFSWSLLFLILVFGFYKTNKNALILLLFVFVSSVLGYNYSSLSSLEASTAAKIYTGSLKDTSQLRAKNIGIAPIDDQQWDRLIRLDTLLNARLQPDETYLDLTSRNAQYFYLNRHPILPVTAVYNMASIQQQKRAVELMSPLPKLALLQADNIIHDGGGLALRTPYIYRFIVDNYIPQYENGFIVGYRRSDVNNSNVIHADIKKVTNENWQNGINRNAAALIINDPYLISMLQVGDKIRLKSDEIRKVTRIWVEGSAIWLTGAPLLPSEVYDDYKIDILVNKQFKEEYTTALFQSAFSLADYQKIPVSWGKSAKSLSNKMALVENFDDISPTLNELSVKDDVYRVDGNDPQLHFDISSKNLSGLKAGLLKFNFKCLEQYGEVRFQIYWWGDERNLPFEMSSIKFTAENGNLIVPLDASPWWLTLNKIKGIRIDIDNASACRAFNIQNISLYQRIF